MKRRIRATTIGLATVMALFGGVVNPLELMGHLNSQVALANGRSRYNPPPTTRTYPGGRTATITRTGASCPTKKDAVIALAPETAGKEGDDVWGYTVSEKPTLWFYVPFSKEKFADLTIDLLVQEEVSQGTFKTLGSVPVNQPDAAGFVSVQIPSDVAPLAANKPYRWFLRLNCAGHPLGGAKGWVERVAKSSALSQMASLSPLQQADEYAKNGIWYDALTVLGNQRRVKSSDPVVDGYWNGLLSDVGLGQIAASPIVKDVKTARGNSH